MGLSFDSPAWLLLLAPLAAYMLWTARHTPRLFGTRKKAALTLRAATLLLLIAALAGLQLVESVRDRTVLFAVDRSESMPDGSAGVDPFLRRAAEARAPGDRVGVVASGLDAAVERSADARDLNGFSWGSPIVRTFSNPSAALTLAAGLLPADTSNRIVLISDGLENVGDLLREGALLKDRGVAVDVLPVQRSRPLDASVERLKVPERLFQAEKYALEVTIHSTREGRGTLRLYEDNAEISAQSVDLEQGENRFVLQSLARETGFHRYRAEIFVDGDQQSANNAGYAFSRVTGPPKVLLVEGQEGASANVAKALSAGLMAYDVIPPELLSLEANDYLAYDSVVLVNVPAHRLSERKMALIESAVRDYGIGLVMLGGDESYGLGGYFKTPVEQALPVYMDLRGKREIPTLGLVLVIDKSGSMEGDKIRLAREAAVRTVELLRPKDSIGVLAFDSSPWWVVEPRKLEDPDRVMADIQSIPADGGTEIYTAVEQAYRKLREVDAQRKHIILLTDGQSATNQSYEALAEGMKADNITLSSVAIGTDSDRALLERISKLAGGRYYFTEDQSTIPTIFSREAVLMSRTYVVDQPFVPAYAQGADWYPLFADGVPTVNAYVATTPKETAEMVLASPEPDPLLARWQFGAGRSVAWTSDAAGKWAPDWVSWSQYAEFVSLIIKWTFPQFDTSPVELESRLEGNAAAVRVRGGPDDFAGRVRATVVGESLEPLEIDLLPEAPGEYGADVPIREPGVYLTRVDFEPAEPSSGAEDARPRSVTSGFVVPYSAEYRIGLADDGAAKLRRLAELTGGRVLSAERPEEVFAAPIESVRRYHDLSRRLLIAALLIWLADIAVRRLSLPWERWLQAAAGLRRRGGGPAAEAGGGTFARLSARKAQASRRTASGSEGAAPGTAASAAERSAGAAASPTGGSGGRTGIPDHGVDGDRGSGAGRADNALRPDAAGPDASPDAAASAPGRLDADPAGAERSAGGRQKDGSTAMERLLAAKKRTRR